MPGKEFATTLMVKRSPGPTSVFVDTADTVTSESAFAFVLFRKLRHVTAVITNTATVTKTFAADLMTLLSGFLIIQAGSRNIQACRHIQEL